MIADKMIFSYEAAMGLAEDDRPFRQEPRLSSLDIKDDESLSSEESFSKENKEDDFNESQQFLNSINLVQDSTEHIETFAGNRHGFPGWHEFHKIQERCQCSCKIIFIVFIIVIVILGKF